MLILALGGCLRPRPAIVPQADVSPSGRSSIRFVAEPGAAPAPTDPLVEIVPPLPKSGNSNPAYPDDALIARAGRASVTLAIVIAEDGSVRSAEPTDAVGAAIGPFADSFVGAAQSAVLDWKFVSARRLTSEPGPDRDGDGRYDYLRLVSNEGVAFRTAVTVEFEISDPRTRDPDARDIERRLAAEHPGIRVEVRERILIAGTTGRSALFEWHGDLGSAPPVPYGSGIALWRHGKLDWVHVEPGDYGIYLIAWIDLDGDGDTDLAANAGGEGVSRTILFLADGEDRSGPRALRVAHENDSGYVILIDPDRDGVPDVLDPIPGMNDERYYDDPVCPDSHIPAAVEKSIEQERARLCGSVCESFPNYSLEDFLLFDPVRILRIRQGRVLEVTREYRDHLEWRIRTVEAVRATSGTECSAALDALIADLRRRAAE